MNMYTVYTHTHTHTYCNVIKSTKGELVEQKTKAWRDMNSKTWT